jgi:hypothetical protein
MVKEINPLDVAFVEKDVDVGGYFVYLDSDLRDRLTEPVGHIISARVYSRLVSTYGIPNIDQYTSGKRKNVEKIKTLISKLNPQKQAPQQQSTLEQIQEEPIPLSHTSNVDGGVLPVIPHTHMSNGGMVDITTPVNRAGGLINRPLRVSSDVIKVSNNNIKVDSKTCLCGHIMLRTDYPDMLDVNWDSKKYCSKQCARKYRKQS